MARPPKGTTPEMRFNACVKKTPRCWIWTGARQHTRKPNNLNYGFLKVTGKSVLAHRYAYELAHGPIPDGKIVRHDCDNPLCVRPAHLFLDTQAGNVADCVAKRRHACGRDYENAKLSDAIVRRIRAIHKPYCRVNGSGALARKHGVHPSVIDGVVKRTRWRHVHG